MLSTEQVHGGYKSNKAKIMVPMQMTYEDMAYFIDLNPGFRHAKLCSFPTIDQQIGIIHLQDLSSLISIKCRRS